MHTQTIGLYQIKQFLMSCCSQSRQAGVFIVWKWKELHAFYTKKVLSLRFDLQLVHRRSPKMALSVKSKFFGACLEVHSYNIKIALDQISCPLKDLHLLNTPTKNQRDCASRFHTVRTRILTFSKINQVQGHFSPLVPPSSNTNFCVLVDIYLYFEGSPKKFCYRNV